MALDLGTLVARLRVDNDMGRGLNDGRRAMDGFSRDVNGRLRDMRGRFVSESAAMGRGLGDGLDRGSRRGLGGLSGRLRGLGDTLGNLGQKGAAGIGQLAASMGKLAAQDPKKTVMILGGLIAGLPLTAGIAASAITVGLGGAIAGIGIKAAASAKSVKSAFGDLQDDMKAGLRDAAAPFEGSLVRMVATARKEMSGLGPFVTRAFARLAPAVEKAFGSVMRVVGDLGPTIDNIAAKAGPLLEVLGKELGSLVRSLAGNFRDLANASDPRFITVLVGAVRILADAITGILVKGAEFGSWIADLIDKIPNVDFGRPAASAKGLGEAFAKTAAGARDVSETIQEVTDRLAEFFDPSIAVFNATTRIKESFKSLVEALKESKGELNGNSAAALQARNAFAGALTSVTDLYKATVQKTGSDEKAKKAIEDQLPVLYALAGQNQGARNQVDALAKSFGMVPGAVLPAEKSFLAAAKAMGIGEDQARSLYKQLDKKAEIKADISDLQSKLRTAVGDLAKVPKEKRAEVLANISDLQKKLKQAQKELDRLQSKTINVSVQVKQYGSTDALRRLSGYATGGLVEGPGTGTSDSVPAMLSRGEYVLPAKVVKRVGVKKLDALRKGKDTGFGPVSTGGPREATFGTVDINGNGTPGTGALSARDQAAIRRHDRRVLIKAIEGQVKTLKAGLAKVRDAREELLEGLTSMSSDTVKSTSRGLADMVRDAFKGLRGSTTMDDRLLARISSTSKQLQKLADERTKVAERLQEALAFAAGVTGRAKGDASVLGIDVVDEDGQRVDPTGGELATGLKARLETLRKFSGDIKNLAAQGLSQTILRDLMEAGPAAAGGIAAAIGQGGQGVIQELTQLQNAIDAEAKELGEFSADHLYDAGAKAGEGFLTGLQGQLDTLEATMEALANRLITTVTNGIAAAQKLAEEKAEKLKAANEKDKPKDKPKQGTTWGAVDINGGGRKPETTWGKVDIGGGKKTAALTIQNYHEAPGGNSRKTAEDLLLLTRARG